jgi:hypothetical protein
VAKVEMRLILHELSAADPPVQLELKAVLDRAFDAADYGKYIYAETPEPPLSPDAEVWAKQFTPQHP